MSFILIDDGSMDGTGESLDRWVSTHQRCSFVEHKESIGKAAALQDALALMSPVAEVIAVLDADTRPEPSYLLELVAPFADPRCGAVTGQARPLIEPHSAIGLYAALEIWVYQGITLAAKDRLGLNPPTVGGICAYRRSALEEAGGFPGDAQAEDIAISLAMNSRGWETRFQPMAISRLRTVSHWRHFMHQRRRWSTSLLASAPLAAGPESLAVVLGYADRPLLVAGVFLIAVGFLPVSTLALYVLPA